jgi:hypothetical protein
MDAAAAAGAVGALVLTRSALRAPVQRATARWRPAFRALDAAVEKDAFSIIFLLRLSPLVPFAVASLLLALTPVPLGTYAAATALGALVSAVPFAYAGHAGGLLARAGADAATASPADGAYDQLQARARCGDAVPATRTARAARAAPSPKPCPADGATHTRAHATTQVLMTVVGLLATVAVSIKISAVVRDALASAAARHSGSSALACIEEGEGGGASGAGSGGAGGSAAQRYGAGAGDRAAPAGDPRTTSRHA